MSITDIYAAQQASQVGFQGVRPPSNFGAGVVRQPSLRNMTAPPPHIGNMASPQIFSPAMQGVIAQLAAVPPANLGMGINPYAQQQMIQGFPQGGMASMQNMGGMPPHIQAAMQYAQTMQPQGYAQQGGQPQGQMSNPMQGAMGGIVESAGSAGVNAAMQWLGGKPAGEAFEGFKKDVKAGAINQTSDAIAAQFGLDEDRTDALKASAKEKFLGLKKDKPSESSEEEKSSAASEVASKAVTMAAGAGAKAVVGAAVVAAGGSAAAAAGAGVVAAAAVTTAAGKGDMNDAMKKVGGAIGDTLGGVAKPADRTLSPEEQRKKDQ